MKIKFTLEQPMKAQRRGRGIALVFLNLGAKWRCLVNTTPRPIYPWVRDPVPIVQKTGWAPGPVWTGAENLTSACIQSPDRPACSQSLYQLRYPGPVNLVPYLYHWLTSSNWRQVSTLLLSYSSICIMTSFIMCTDQILGWSNQEEWDLERGEVHTVFGWKTRGKRPLVRQAYVGW